MQCCPSDGERVNSFALVSYIPDPLGSFFDQLRQEIAPGCKAHAHVTLLPPRPLRIAHEEAWQEIAAWIQDYPPFVLELTAVEVFPATLVAYVAVGAGYSYLSDMHDELARGKLAFDEPFEYHPHMTVAQDIGPEALGPAVELARRRWAEFPDDRRFTLDSVTFVQNWLNPKTGENGWIDLAQCTLAKPVPIG